jgi:ubiquinone/menaquinone biosynthesis C-methylase UbiE
MVESKVNAGPSPQLFFDTVNAYQRTSAIKAALELDVFTAIGEGEKTSQQLASRCGTSERGMRILCDYLVVLGFLAKQENRYDLTLDSAAFLNRHSPMYLGSSIGFLLSPMLTDNFKDLAAAVRKGGTVMSDEGTVAYEHPIWIEFARSMAPVTALPAQNMARLVRLAPDRDSKVLDIAAGHGKFGLAFAAEYPRAEIVALDWPKVLEVARENARAAGLESRFRTIPGSAFDADYGSAYDVVLLTNFLHHFNPETCEKLLRRVKGALRKGGRAVVLDFVPNEDRVTPPGAASFSLMMLGSTPSGDAYTFSEYERMFRNAGFAHTELHALPPTFESVVISDG